MSVLAEKEKKAIEWLRMFMSEDDEQGYYLADSGGKDSSVCRALLQLSGLPFDAHYRVTSVDPPELVRFIEKYHPDTKREIPRYADGKPITMWNLIPKKLMPPTRIIRYCCEALKEDGGNGRKVVTGVRWAESTNRARNQGAVSFPEKRAGNALKDNSNFFINRAGGAVLVMDNDESRLEIENCVKHYRVTVNPIIDWTDAEVWEYIRYYYSANHNKDLAYCELYDKGFCRMGCLGCPMGRKKQREREFALYPKFKEAYLRAFDRMLKERERRGKGSRWHSAEEVMRWWLEDENAEGQLTMFGEETEEAI